MNYELQAKEQQAPQVENEVKETAEVECMTLKNEMIEQAIQSDKIELTVETLGVWHNYAPKEKGEEFKLNINAQQNIFNTNLNDETQNLDESVPFPPQLEQAAKKAMKSIDLQTDFEPVGEDPTQLELVVPEDSSIQIDPTPQPEPEPVRNEVDLEQIEEMKKSKEELVTTKVLLETSQNDILNLTNEIEEYKIQVQNLSTVDQNRQTEIATLNSELDRYKAEIGNLEIEVEKYKGEGDNFQNEITKLTQDIQEQNVKITELEKGLQESKDLLAQKSDEVNSLHEETGTEAQKVQELEEKLKISNSALENLKIEHTNLSQRYETLEEENKHFKSLPSEEEHKEMAISKIKFNNFRICSGKAQGRLP